MGYRVFLDKLISPLFSRRFWALVASACLGIWGEQFGVDPEMIKQIIFVASAWIMGDSLSKTSLMNHAISQGAYHSIVERLNKK